MPADNWSPRHAGARRARAVVRPLIDVAAAIIVSVGLAARGPAVAIPMASLFLVIISAPDAVRLARRARRRVTAPPPRQRSCPVTPFSEYAADLSARLNGPHDDSTTADAGMLAAEAIRYLCYATASGGLTNPATVYTLTGELAITAAGLPLLLSRLADWLDAQGRTGHIADGYHRPGCQATAETRAALARAARHARDLARALDAAQSHARTLYPADPG